MKPPLTHTSASLEDIRDIRKTHTIGKCEKPLKFQPPKFQDIPLIFCS